MTTRQDDDAPVIEDQPEIAVETAASDDPEEIRSQIEETRAELGETVEALAAKADVPGRVKAKLSAGTEQLKEKVGASTEQLKEKVGASTEQLKEKVGSATPEQARDVVASLPQRLKARPLPGVFLAGLLIGWLVGRRR